MTCQSVYRKLMAELNLTPKSIIHLLILSTKFDFSFQCIARTQTRKGHSPYSASSHTLNGCHCSQDKIQLPGLALQALVTSPSPSYGPFPTLPTSTRRFQPADSPLTFMTQLKLLRAIFSKAMKINSSCSEHLQQMLFYPFTW